MSSAGSSLDTTPPVILRTNPSEIPDCLILPSFDEPLTVTFSEADQCHRRCGVFQLYELRWAGPDELFGEWRRCILFDLIPSYAVGIDNVSGIDIVGGSLSDGFYRFIYQEQC